MTYPPTGRARDARRVSLAVMVGALLATILVVGLIVFALSQRGDGGVGQSPASGVSGPASPSASVPPSVVSSASASVGSSASAAPEPTEAAAGPPTITWEEPSATDGNPLEILADRDMWVAVGRATERGPGAWTSSDGQTWEGAAVVDPRPDPVFGGSTLGPTVRFGDSLLSYGTFIGCCDGRGVLGWRSADGRSWEVIESESPLFASGYLVNELVVGGSDIVAVEGRYSSFSGRTWRWTEQTSWVETTPNTAGTDQPSGMNTNDVAWADGRFVVVGARGTAPGGGAVSGASWTSTDGQTWEESASAPELEDVELLEVAPIPGGGFVALGISDAANFGNAGATIAFTSPDGLVWTPAQMPPMGQHTRPVDVLAAESGLVAIGSEATNTTVVWASADGVTWTDAGRLDHAPVAAAVMGDDLIVITADYEGVQSFVNRGRLSRGQPAE